MAEHHLNRAQIGATLQQVRGKRMAQHVRAERPRQARLAPVCLEDLPEADSSQARAAARVDEQFCRRLALQERGPALLQVAGQPCRGLVADRHEALLAALAEAGEVTALEVEVLLAETDHFRHAQPRRVEQLDQRAVAQAARLRDVRRAKQAIDFICRQEFRQRLPGSRRAHVGGRIVGAMIRDDEKPIEATKAGHGPRDRFWGPPLAHHLPDHVLERAAIQRLDRTLARSGRGGQLGQVAPVALHGVRRQPPLDGEMRQIGVDQSAHASQSVQGRGNSVPSVRSVALLRPLTPTAEGTSISVSGSEERDRRDWPQRNRDGRHYPPRPLIPLRSTSTSSTPAAS